MAKRYWLKTIMDSELRQDLVTGDWILVAPGRAKRPGEFIKKKEKQKEAPKNACPFEDPQKNGNGKPILIYPENNSKWKLQIIPNKFPAVSENGNMMVWGKHGPYVTLPGFGRHDLIITRDHKNNFPLLSPADAELVFRSFKDRYRMLLEESKFLAYVSIFHNWGAASGASIYHPHYQIIAVPIIPPDITHSLRGSSHYFEKNKKCVHCVMIDWEKKDGKRVVYENNGAIAFAPYISRSPFELRVFPKSHQPFFEDTPESDILEVVEALQKTLKILESKLKGPDYNFFIHTAPILEKNNHSHYHWHIEIRPHVSIPAGFELSTGIDINVIDPEVAAKFLVSKSR